MKNTPDTTVDRIVRTNHAALAHALDHAIQALGGVHSPQVLLLSPHANDWRFIKSRLPGARLYVATAKTWDLNDPLSGAGYFDLIVASNVFHYSREPRVWFDNVLARTRYLVLQDLIYRRRSPRAPFLGNDGDAVRYCYSRRGVTSGFAEPFDLSEIDARIVWFQDYEGGRNELHPDSEPAPRHFVLVARGGDGPLSIAPPMRRFRVEAFLYDHPALMLPVRVVRKARAYWSSWR